MSLPLSTVLILFSVTRHKNLLPMLLTVSLSKRLTLLLAVWGTVDLMGPATSGLCVLAWGFSLNKTSNF